MQRRRIQGAYRRYACGVAAGLSLLGQVVLCGQTPISPPLAPQTPLTPLTIDEAVQLALKNYPAIAESRARAQAADASVAVAQTAYLPRVDAVWQENRATNNNVFGLPPPQGVIPPISGPVLGTHAYDGVWSSAGGVLLSWEAVDFGLRRAGVDVARAQRTVPQARPHLTQLALPP